MKIILVLYLLFFWQAIASAQDLPSPTANLQTMPQDSYVIAMDNTWQATTGTNPSFHYFNLKSYGLIVYLLNNNVKVKRIIRAGKKKDEVDFSVSCRQVKPRAETSASVRSFKAGPFVIFGSDLLRINIDQLIDNFNNNIGGVSGIKSDTAKVRVYKTTADAKVDVRYDLTDFKPKASILNDGSLASGINYTQVHLTYMSLAGVPAANYVTGANSDLDVACFTFASEPHNDYQNATVVNNIKKFVLAGGNFLAQCAAILNYESLGHFQSTFGLNITNSTPSAVYFPNADLSMAQFEGGFSIKQGGSCQNWQYSTGWFANNGYALVTNTNGFVSRTSLIGASASKLLAASLPGGMTFYLGNHSYTRTDDYNHINGIRMYLNAFLTPPNTKNILHYSYSADCNAGAMKVASFNGPALAYPVSFYLYQDNGTTKGEVDAADAFIGATTVASPGVQKLIPLGSNSPKGDFVMKVVPNASCYKTEQVSPTPCRFITLSAALKNFTASRSGEQVLLRWQTLTEQANDGFYVQRLINSEWRDIGFVPSAANGGNSNNSLQYQFVTDALKGTTQYRIRMQNIYKAVSYSDVRLVRSDDASLLFSIYPSPSVNGTIELYFSDTDSRSVTVYDVAGRVVRLYTRVGGASFEISKMNSGIYFIKVIESSGQVQTEKLVVK